MTQPSDRPKLNVLPPQDVTARNISAGSFHAGAPIPTIHSFRRQSSTHRYQTFPVQPPKTPIEAPIPSSPDASSAASQHDDDDSSLDSPSSVPDHGGGGGGGGGETPLPRRQLLLLAFLSLSEQTALNSIGPYLPQMVASMPRIPPGQSGLYVGLLASAFALAQLSTNFLWGYASDIVGRKPVLIAGTFALMCCFCFFGLCSEYWQVVLVHALMGLLNGNAACVPTVLGEVTDRSNQSRAFTYLPVIYSLGSITGPALGGVLVGKMGGHEYPFLGPNVLAVVLLGLSVILMSVWFQETLDKDSSDDSGPPKPAWLTRVTNWMAGEESPAADANRASWSSRLAEASATQQQQRQPLLSSSSSSTASSEQDSADSQEEEHARTKLDSSHGHRPVWKDLLNHTTLMLLSTYLIFQLSNVSFNSLYPIFASAPAPSGRNLDPARIGVSLSLAGLASIIFQAFLFQSIKSKVGNLGSYRFALLGLGISMLLIPWVGHLDDDPPPLGLGTGSIWLYSELAVILVLKNICAVSGLSSVMLLITNSAPSHASLGTLNGVAQTLSALGRSIGPFVSGALFTLSVDIQPKGEALVWSLFGGLALVGGLVSLFIHGEGLESEEWEETSREAGAEA